MSATAMASQTPQPRLGHLSDEMVRRVAMTISCRDTDAIPKVDGAGEVFEEGGRRLQRMHNGVVIEEGCYQVRWMTEVIRCLRGHHEPQEEFVFHQVVECVAHTEEEPSMIELGAWWAYYSLWFAARVPSARIVALEPDPERLEVGRRNFQLNDLSDRATFVRGEIGPTPDPLRTRIREPMPPACHDLRSLLEASRLERVSLLHVDIQGAETVLLDRARADSRVRTSAVPRRLHTSPQHLGLSGHASVRP